MVMCQTVKFWATEILFIPDKLPNHMDMLTVIRQEKKEEMKNNSA